jgi:hypothetical protein
VLQKSALEGDAVPYPSELRRRRQQFLARPVVPERTEAGSVPPSNDGSAHERRGEFTKPAEFAAGNEVNAGAKLDRAL